MKVGLIGCGRVAHIHMNAYKSIEDLEVVAVSDTNARRAEGFAKPYKIKKFFTDYGELLRLDALDFVDICTPTSTHESIVRDAARAGLNVLMEKPMGRNSSECERMIEETRKHNTKLCICHNQLFYPYVQQLRSISDSEDFKLVSFRTSHRENFEWLKAHDLAQSWNVNPEHGGILWEVGTHLAYLQLSFLKHITEIYAVGTKAKYSVWDDFVVLFRTGSECFGIMEISWVAKESEIVYEIIDSTGKRIQTYLPHGYIVERMQESPSNAVSTFHNWFTDERRLFGKWYKFTKDQFKKPQLGHFSLISSYIRSLEDNFPSPVTGEDGRNAIRLLECIEESLVKKKPIPFSSW
jgi:UDP-N-acetyl-2-amino-2-deoxyglucuronate dehydrogenase